MRATRAIIHLDNLRSNIREIKKLIPQNTKICFPVKADGYGHGAIELSKIALHVDFVLRNSSRKCQWKCLPDHSR